MNRQLPPTHPRTNTIVMETFTLRLIYFISGLSLVQKKEQLFRL